MKAGGIIDKASFSMYLGPKTLSEDETGYIVLGGYDNSLF